MKPFDHWKNDVVNDILDNEFLFTKMWRKSHCKINNKFRNKLLQLLTILKIVKNCIFNFIIPSILFIFHFYTFLAFFITYSLCKNKF